MDLAVGRGELAVGTRSGTTCSRAGPRPSIRSVMLPASSQMPRSRRELARPGDRRTVERLRELGAARARAPPAVEELGQRDQLGPGIRGRAIRRPAVARLRSLSGVEVSWIAATRTLATLRGKRRCSERREARHAGARVHDGPVRLEELGLLELRGRRGPRAAVRVFAELGLGRRDVARAAAPACRCPSRRCAEPFHGQRRDRPDAPERHDVGAAARRRARAAGSARRSCAPRCRRSRSPPGGHRTRRASAPGARGVPGYGSSVMCAA